MIFKYISGCLIFLWVLNFFFNEWHFPSNYEYIPLDSILHELHYAKNIPHNNQPNCNISSNLYNRFEYETWEIQDTRHIQTPKKGGEYVPSNCNTDFSVAIIVPYKNRTEQLKIFLNYFHNFLQHQNLHYRIFIVDQHDSKAFNRAKLLNIGAVEAIKLRYPCVILHDIDLIPLNSGNLYVCTKLPRHMSTNLNLHRYNLLYDGLFGGATAVRSSHFELINGMSNLYFGWGGEDDDFYTRLVHNNLQPCRYDPMVGKYAMLKHKKETPNKDRFTVLGTSLQRYRHDGLNSIDSLYDVHSEPLYTHIIVKRI